MPKVVKPCSSVFCWRLETAVKVVCKSFLFLVLVSTTLNVYMLDYPGPRKESVWSLGVVAIFLTLLLASALSGHVGADRAGIFNVTLSLALLICAILHWLVVGTMSLVGIWPRLIWSVCIENRCAETLWTMNTGYRVEDNNIVAKSPTKNYSEVGLKLKAFGDSSKLSKQVVQGNIFENENYSLDTLGRNHFNTDKLKKVMVMETYENFTNGIKYSHLREKFNNEHDEKTIHIRPIGHLNKSATASSTAIAVTAVCFIFFAVYFVTCATIIFSYFAEVYEEHKIFLKQEKDEFQTREVINKI